MSHLTLTSASCSTVSATELFDPSPLKRIHISHCREHTNMDGNAREPFSSRGCSSAVGISDFWALQRKVRKLLPYWIISG